MLHGHAIALISVLTAGGTALLNAQGLSGTNPEIRTSGTGSQAIAPDLVTVTVAISTHEKTAVTAGKTNARIARAIRSALVGIGVPADSIVTHDYVVQAAPRWQGDTLAYAATNAVVVRLRQLRLISRAVDTALTAGASSVSGVTYSADDTKGPFREALRRAVDEATRNAATMAEAAGGHLGALIELTTESQSSWDGGLQIRGGGDSTPFSTGPMAVTASVVGRWEFVAGR